MHKTVNAFRGMVSSPHHLASEAGLGVLREGGSAVEAVIAAGACLCVVYPHMCGLGGDAFWTLYDPASARVTCIDAAGHSGLHVHGEYLKKRGHTAIPRRGPQAMITCAGAVSGWQRALETATGRGKPLPLSRLFADAIHYAEQGYPVSAGQASLIRNNLVELGNQPGFSDQFLHNGLPPVCNQQQTLPALARTFKRLAQEGLDSFYRGKLAETIVAELAELGSPLVLDDFKAQQARVLAPLVAEVSGARLYNCPPPSQGVASLMILGIYDALTGAGEDARRRQDGLPLVHGLVESTKRAFAWRDAHVADAAHMRGDVAKWLTPAALKELATGIRADSVLPWGAEQGAGDTVWLGAVDAAGRVVSCIQSIYFEFGTGVVLPETGITWHNRGLGFSLLEGHPNALGPRKRPFHTLNPALAIFTDGRVMAYGSMGGEGQPQTQSALFSRYAWLGYDVQEAISAPRWVMGRTWGENSTSLKVETDFSEEILHGLQTLGHNLEVVPACNELMGHAGAVVKHAKGLLQGATDPRSDGAVAAF